MRWLLVLLFAAFAMGQHYVRPRPLPLRETAKALETTEMATTKNIWQSTDGNYGTLASWSLNHLPTTNEQGVCDGTLSQVSISSGLDQSLGPAPDEFITTPGYEGDVGASGNPLHFDGGKATIRGTGAAYLNPEVGGAMEIFVDSTNRVNALTLGGLGIGVGARAENIHMKDGKCVVLGDVFLPGNVYCVGERALLIIDPALSSENDPGYFVVEAGYVINHRPTVANRTINVSGGRMDQIGEWNATTFPIVTGSGRLFYKPDAAVSSVPNIYIGGTIDLSETAIDHAYTIVTIGPSGIVKGGAIRSTGIFDPVDLREEYP